jgi:signal peptidase II
MNYPVTTPHRQALRTLLPVAIGVIIADQLIKWVMLEWVNIAQRPAIEITSWFKLVMVWNHGISFGMLSAPDTYVPYLLIVLALGIATVLFWLALRAQHRREWIAYALVIGGALGNVIDRLRFGAVADFFYFHIGRWSWPAFNLADAAICLGVTALLWQSFFLTRRA